MAKFRFSPELRELVAVRAKSCCEYCKCPEAFSPQSFSVDHIIPKSKSGAHTPDNLAFSCQGCNSFKSNKAQAIDPATGIIEDLFNPRQQAWDDHFAWDETSAFIIGLTPCGRATASLLRLNRDYVMNLRKVLILVGEHPPA